MKTDLIFSKPFKRYISVGFLSCIQELSEFEFTTPSSIGSQLRSKKEFIITLGTDSIGFAGMEAFVKSKLSRPECNLITPQDKENIEILSDYHFGKSKCQLDLDFVDHFVSFLANDLELDYRNNNRFKEALLSFLTGFSFAVVYSKFGKDQKRTKIFLSDIERLKKIQNSDRERFKKILDRLNKKYTDPIEGEAC